MRNGHRIQLVGNLGRDPEMRYTPDGTPVCNFSVAGNRRWNNADGTQGSETVWFKVTAWRRLAETCNQYLAQGRQVYVEGRIVVDPETGAPKIWSGQDNQPRVSLEVNADSVLFLGGNGNGAAAPEAAPAVETDELPF